MYFLLMPFIFCSILFLLGEFCGKKCDFWFFPLYVRFCLYLVNLSSLSLSSVLAVLIAKCFLCNFVLIYSICYSRGLLNLGYHLNFQTEIILINYFFTNLIFTSLSFLFFWNSQDIKILPLMIFNNLSYIIFIVFLIPF